MERQQHIKKIKAEMNKPLGANEQRNLKRKAEDATMAGADIILSTLSSSLNRKMEKYFVQGYTGERTMEAARKINICIMDEASQCVEPEALIPFKLGFRKLVMVGDHEQLQGTVISVKAKEMEYQQSLFGRLVSFLTHGGHSDKENAGSTPPMSHTRSPILRLDTQYRMHPDIVLWPNKYFYGGVLNTGTSKMENKLVPYLFLDVEGEAVTERGNCSNKSEVKVIKSFTPSYRMATGRLIQESS